MRSTPLLKNYWIFILVAFNLLIFDLGMTAYFVIRDDPHAEVISVGYDRVTSMNFSQVAAQTDEPQVEWVRPPSEELIRSESLMQPLAFAFLGVCSIGIGLKAYSERKKVSN